MADLPTPSRRLAVTLGALPGEPRRALERLATLGVGGVQLSAAQPGMRPRELGVSARRDLLATLRRRELSVHGVDLWIPPDHFTDVTQVDRAVAALIETIEFASDLGRCPVSTSLPMDGSPELLEAVLGAAEARGVTLVHHCCPMPSPTPWREGLSFGMDTAAWLSHDEDPIEACTSAGHHLGAVRLVDLFHSGLRGPIGHGGDGRLDIAVLAITLSAISYSGPLIIDARQWNDPWTGVGASINAWSASAPPQL